jgi:nitrogen fixation protein NifQ
VAYDWLVAASGASRCDPFDIHVAASILALAIEESFAGEGASLSVGVGLDRATLARIADAMFPAVAADLARLAGEEDPVRDAEETSVRDIVLMYASGDSWLEPPLAAMIARRCRQPNHLWQDLGLRERGELSILMQRHFGPLARKNASDMKWKKFLYRTICSAAEFTLCTAPVCSDCDDFDACFGAEDGEALLARLRNAGEPGRSTHSGLG